MRQNLRLIVGPRDVAEGQDDVLADARRRGGRRSCAQRQLIRGNVGRLGAVNQVPQSGCSRIVLGVDRTGVEHRHSTRRNPDQLIHQVGLLLGQSVARRNGTVQGCPNLYGLYLAASESCKRELRGRTCVVGPRRNGNL